MIEREDLTIESEPGVELFVREVRSATSRGGVPVVLVHGAYRESRPSISVWRVGRWLKISPALVTLCT
jgi:hypothetical protein